MHRASNEYIYLQLRSTSVHPAYFGEIFATLSLLLPFHWKFYVDQFRALDLFHIFHGWLPSLQPPKKKVYVGARMRWTVFVLGVFLVMEQTPIYGLQARIVEHDYLMWFRPLAASSEGTVTPHFRLRLRKTDLKPQLMELGMFPIGVISVVSCLLEISSWWEALPTKKGDSDLRQTAKGAIAVLVILGLSILYVRTPFVEIRSDGPGALTRFLVVLQLAGGGLVVYFLNEILDSYGMCSAFTLFMTANTCRTFLWQAFSPVTTDTGRGDEFDGSLLCLVHLLLSRRNKSQAIYESLIRQNQPNLVTLGSSLFVLVAIIYLQGARVELPIMSTSQLGQRGTYPIKLLYSPHGSIIFLFQTVYQLLVVTQLGAIFCPEIWAKRFWFLGVWEMHESKPELVPVAGLCYWLTPPTWRTLLTDQLRSFVYVTYMLLTCAILSRLAIRNEECNENPENVIADLLGPTQVTLATTTSNPDDALKKEVQRLIPTSSILGGLVLGCIYIASDVFGVIGGGQGMLVTTSILYRGYEMWLKEQKEL